MKLILEVIVPYQAGPQLVLHHLQDAAYQRQGVTLKMADGYTVDVDMVDVQVSQ